MLVIRGKLNLLLHMFMHPQCRQSLLTYRYQVTDVIFFPVFLPTHTHTSVFYLFLNGKVPSGHVSLEEKRCSALFWGLIGSQFGDTTAARSAVNSGTSAVEWIHHIPQHRGRVGLCLQHPWQKKTPLGVASFWLWEEGPSSVKEEQQCSPKCSVIKVGKWVDDHWHRKGSSHTPYRHCSFQGDSQSHTSAEN